MQKNVDSRNQVQRLFEVRNQYGSDFRKQKENLLQSIVPHQIKGAKTLTEFYDVLLFLLAYPDDKAIYELAANALRRLETYINDNVKVQERLYNSGVTGGNICAAFGFEIAKWLRKRYGKNLLLESIEADEAQITYVLSVVMTQVESEIM